MKKGVCLIAIAALFSACGSGESSTPKKLTGPGEGVTNRATARAFTRSCLEGKDFEVRNAGNALRVESLGRRLANVQTFDRPRQAKAFKKQLIVRGGYRRGARSVAVWLSDPAIYDREMEEIENCLG